MATVRFLKIFRGYREYKNVIDIENEPNLEKIETSVFPHTEYNLHIVALIGLPPKFHGEISGRIAWANIDLGAGGVHAPNEKTWLTFDKKLEKVAFQKPGKYPVEILVNNKVVHFCDLVLVEKK